MNASYTLKHWLKLGRWRARRISATFRWGSKELQSAPAVLGNAMPKSGSHLIIQVLQGLTRMGPFVNPGFPPVNRAEDNHKLPDECVLENIKRMKPGDIGYGYISAQEPFVSALTHPSRATVFVYRDPRDMIVSHIFYATQMHDGHWMRSYYAEQLGSMEDRITAAIQGVKVPGSELTPVRERYDGYIGWLELPSIMCLRFEDLILARDYTLGQILDYLEIRGFTPTVPRTQAVEMMNEAISPKRSGTFRKGEPGNWREHFSEANKTLFKDKTGDLLIRLGYEKDNNW